MLEGSSFERREDLHEKVTKILMPIPSPTFRAVVKEWKSRLLHTIEAGGEYLSKHPFSTI
jgi:hypothetical protein